MKSVLIVDDDARFRQELSLQLDEHKVVEVESIEAFRQVFHPYAFDLIVLDMRIESSRDGLLLLEEIIANDPYQLVIVVTKYVDTETHIAAIGGGAQLYLNKDEFSVPFIVQMCEVILQQGHLQRKVRTLEKQLEEIISPDMIGVSIELNSIREKIQQVADDGEVTVLIRGESGTGKELVARNIHRLSRKRKDAPFIAVSVAGLQKTTIHSDLFGHEKGAFTGADKQRKGFIEEAHGGTLFLDEIGDLDLDAQVKLLRVLETRTFQRLGSNREISTNFQLVTATHQNLNELIEQGKFRRDLYYRLQAFEIWIPTLIERKNDIMPLAEHFLQQMIMAGRTTAEGFHRKVIEVFMNYNWPGNIRELKNVIEYAAIQSRTSKATLVFAEHLPISLTGKANISAIESSNMNYIQCLANRELELCESFLNEHGEQNKSDIAAALGYNDRFVFARRIKKAFSDAQADGSYPLTGKLFKRDKNIT